MILRLSCPLRVLLLALVAVCAACAQRETALVKPAPSAFRKEPSAPEYVAPQLAIDREGNAYLIWLAVEWRKRWDVLFSRSRDYGVTWSEPPTSLKPGEMTMAGGIRIATAPEGHVYVTWRDMDHDRIHRKLVFRRSEDSGAHWDGASRSLSVSSDLDVPHLVAESDGKVYVAWLNGSEAGRWLEVAISHDFGAAFLPEPFRLTAAHATSVFGINEPRFVSDGEGHLYVVWEEAKTLRDYRIYLNRSLDRGKTWESHPVLLNHSDRSGFGAGDPQLVAGRTGQVYVVWEQEDKRVVNPQVPGDVGGYDRMIYINRSLDYGQTWLAKAIRLNEAGTEPVTAFHPQMSIDQNGNVYVVWIEAEGPHPKRVLFARSADSGLTWGAPKRLDLTSPFRARLAQPRLRSDDAGHVWVLWQELTPRPRGWQLLMNQSGDYGRTWRKQAIPLTGPTQRGGSFRGASFQNDEHGHLYVAWDGGPQNAQEIYLNRSADFGATWLPGEVRVGQR